MYYFNFSTKFYRREVFFQQNLDTLRYLEKRGFERKKWEKGKTALFRSFLPFPPSKPAAQAPFHLTYSTHSSKQAVVYVKYDLACFWYGNCKVVDFISHKLN